jgi:hypothetical protein
MNKIKIFETAHDFVLWSNESIQNMLNANFVCYFTNSENVYILKNRNPSGRGEVDYATFLEILGHYDKSLQMKYRIKKLSEIAKTYNVTIITATQAQDPSSRYIPPKDDNQPDVIFIDYADILKSY